MTSERGRGGGAVLGTWRFAGRRRRSLRPPGRAAGTVVRLASCRFEGVPGASCGVLLRVMGRRGFHGWCWIRACFASCYPLGPVQ